MSFGPTLSIQTHNSDLDTVLVQHGTHLVGGQVDVRLAIIAHQKAVSIAMPLHLTFDFFQHPAGWSHFFDIQSLDS